MQLLIVHDDAEVGGQLMGLVQDYTAHQCDLVESDAVALAWARRHARCELLLAQLEGPAVNGLTLGGPLGEIFPGLQTLFFPAYPAGKQRVEVAKTKVFPEPIDGERLLEAIETVAEAGSDAPDFFDVLDVLQMCCLSAQSGAVQLVKQGRSGIVDLRDGRITHAETAAADGTEALREMMAWGLVEFAYDPAVRASETISLSWDDGLLQACLPAEKETLEESVPEHKPPAPRVAAAPPNPPRRGFFSALRRS
jgi:hypothetical protein